MFSMTLTSYISWILAYKLVINVFQKRGLGILRDTPQVDAFRIPNHVKLTEFTGVDFNIVQNCAVSLQQPWHFVPVLSGEYLLVRNCVKNAALLLRHHAYFISLSGRLSCVNFKLLLGIILLGSEYEALARQ